jgi:hypothetical protein
MSFYFNPQIIYIEKLTTISANLKDIEFVSWTKNKLTISWDSAF